MRLPVVLFILAIGAARADNAPLEAWLARQAAVRSLDTAFTQQRTLPALKKPISTPGRLSFKKPDKVRWQLGDPFETLAISDGENLLLLDAATKTARRVRIDSPQAARFAMLTGDSFQSPQAFFKEFEVVESRVASGIHQYTLKPKDRRVRAQVPWVFLDIDPKSLQLRAMELELKDKSRVRTVFEHPKFNIALPASLFAPDLSGYTVK